MPLDAGPTSPISSIRRSRRSGRSKAPQGGMTPGLAGGISPDESELADLNRVLPRARSTYASHPASAAAQSSANERRWPISFARMHAIASSKLRGFRPSGPTTRITVSWLRRDRSVRASGFAARSGQSRTAPPALPGRTETASRRRRVRETLSDNRPAMARFARLIVSATSTRR